MELVGNGSDCGVRLKYIYNSDYLGGNAISVYRAREWAQGEPVILCMGDHLIEPRMVKRLLDRQILNETLCIDYTPAQQHKLDETTKVIVDGTGCIKDIGKELICWDAIDAGVFLLTDNFFKAIHTLIQYRGTDVEISDVIRFLINHGHRFDTCNVSDCSWADIDTKEDLGLARRS